MPKLTATFEAIDNMSEKFANMYESGNKAFKQWEQAGNMGDKAFGEVEKSAVTTAKALTDASGQTDFWTDKIGTYNKEAMEFVYTTEELVEEGYKSADALEYEAEMAKKLADELDGLGDKMEDSYPGGGSPGGTGSSPGSTNPETPPSPVPDPDPIDDSRKAMQMYADTLAALGVAKMLTTIADAAMECVDAFQEYETGLAKVSTLADPNIKSMTEISSEIRKVSNEVGQYSTEIAEATYQAISAGVDTADAVEFVATANSLAVGGFTQNATAVDVLTTAINAYGLEVEDASQVSDYLITTQNLGKTTVDELAGSIGRVIPIAAAYNVKMDNLSSAVAIMTANGIATAETMTYLKAMLTELGDSGSTVTTVLLEETGYSFAQLTEQGYSLGDVMAILGDSVDNDAGAFNELWSSTEAGIGALSLMNNGAEKYNAVLEEMKNSSGAADEAFKKMSETSAFMEQKFLVSANNLKIAIGEDLSGVMNGFYGTASSIMDGMTFIVDECPAVTAVIAGGTSSLATLTAGVVGFNTVMKIAKIVQDAFNSSAKANPYILAATAVVGLVSAVSVLATTENDATNKTKELVDKTKELTEANENLAKSAEESMASIEVESSLAMQYTDELGELINKENKTVAEKERMAVLVNELNDIYPELNYQYDKASGLLKDMNGTIIDNTDSIYKNIEAQKKQAEADAYLEYYKKYTAQYVEAQALYEEAVENRQDVYDQQEAWLEEKRGNWLNILNPFYYYEANQWSDAVSDAIDSSNKLGNAAKSAQENAESYWNLYEEAMGIQDDTDLQDGAEKQTKFMEEVCESLNNVAISYQTAYVAAIGSIEGQYELWDKVDAKATTSVSSINSAMQSQIDYWNNYSSNLENLMGRDIEGLDEFINSINDGSEDAAATFAGMAKASDKQLEDMVEKWKKLAEAEQNAAATIADEKSGFSEFKDEVIVEIRDTLEEMDMTEDAYDAAMNTMNGYIKGVENSLPEVKEAFEKVREVVFSVGRSEGKLEISDYPIMGWTWGYKDGYASGTDSATPGWHMVGENGPELMYFNGGETVYNAEETDRMLTSAENPFNYRETTDRFVNVRNENSTSSERRVVLVIEGVGEIAIDKGVDKDEVVEILQSNIKPVLLNILEEDVFEEGDASYDY